MGDGSAELDVDAQSGLVEPGERDGEIGTGADVELCEEIGGRGSAAAGRGGGARSAMSRSAEGVSTSAGAASRSDGSLQQSSTSAQALDDEKEREEATHLIVSLVSKPNSPAHCMTASHSLYHAVGSRARSTSSRTTTLRCVIKADVASSARETAMVDREGRPSSVGGLMSASSECSVSSTSRSTGRAREGGRTVDLVHLRRFELQHEARRREDDEPVRLDAHDERTFEDVLPPALVHDDALLDGELDVGRECTRAGRRVREGRGRGGRRLGGGGGGRQSDGGRECGRGGSRGSGSSWRDRVGGTRRRREVGHLEVGRRSGRAARVRRRCRARSSRRARSDGSIVRWVVPAEEMRVSARPVSREPRAEEGDRATHLDDHASNPNSSAQARILVLKISKPASGSQSCADSRRTVVFLPFQGMPAGTRTRLRSRTMVGAEAVRSLPSAGTDG